jgi:hypothetical protein
MYQHKRKPQRPVLPADEKPDCRLCLYCLPRSPAWEEYPEHAKADAPVCAHDSAYRLNKGPWAISIAREKCRGKRFAHRRKQ